jgi:hypothetical protein
LSEDVFKKWVRGHGLDFFSLVRPCSENGRRKITQNSIEVDAKTKDSTRKTEKKTAWKV